MSKKQDFVEFIRPYVEENLENMNENCKNYWIAFSIKEEKEKPLFTDNGKIILKFLQENNEIETWKSKDIADNIGISSRSVSGSIRKLVTDGFVDKVGENPIYYMLTENGKNIEIGE